MAERPLCPLSALRKGQALGRPLPGGPHGADEVVVLRWQGRVRAYWNRCPHTGASLDWWPGRFFDPEGRFLQCATHGALFRPEDGRCVAGPCVGRALDELEVEVRGGQVWPRR